MRVILVQSVIWLLIEHVWTHKIINDTKSFIYHYVVSFNVFYFG